MDGDLAQDQVGLGALYPQIIFPGGKTLKDKISQIVDGLHVYDAILAEEPHVPSGHLGCGQPTIGDPSSQRTRWGMGVGNRRVKRDIQFVGAIEGSGRRASPDGVGGLEGGLDLYGLDDCAGRAPQLFPQAHLWLVERGDALQLI